MLILVADDEPKVRFGLYVLLQRRPGFEVVGEAKDAEDLLAQIKRSCPDLVLLDWELPGMRAVDLLSALQSVCRDLVVIALSGRLEARKTALAAGADAFVSKTDPPERLLAAIAAYCPGVSAEPSNVEEDVEHGAAINIELATARDAARLTEIQTRTFKDDNNLKPPGCSLEGPPGFDSVAWNAGWIAKTPYYKILFDGQTVGGIIIFDMGGGHYELGRIYIDPDLQNRGIGQQAVKLMFERFPEAEKWTLGTPSWAIRNQHFYEKLGFVQVRETEVDPHLGWSGIEYEKHFV
jgi:DNA-binding NarL/FixJ family response regulator